MEWMVDHPNEIEIRNGHAKLSEPKKIGFYSIGPHPNYSYLNDYSQLKYVNSTYTDCRVNFNLDHNMHLAKRRQIGVDTKPKATQIFLKNNRDCLDVLDTSEISLTDVPFVANHEIFRRISYAPYKNDEPYRISACLFRGVLYIARLWPTENPLDWPKTPNKRLLLSARGHKFEQYMLSDSPTRKPDTEAPVDEDAYFACVFEAFLNQHRLIYTGNMSGILTEGTSLEEGFQPHKHSNQEVLEEIRKLPFVKINTFSSIHNDSQKHFFRSTKTLNWWLQATFIGVKTILCGFRNDKLGIVERIRRYETDDLPEDNEEFWIPDRCMNFCDRFLKFVKRSFFEEICQKHPGSGDNVRHLPMILLAFEIRPKEVFTPSEFVLTQPLPNEDLHILGADFLEMFTD